MKIRLLCLTVLTALCFVLLVHAADVTEISFRIGSDSLSVNGKAVTSVAPYADNGTTLVPLRIISEAFGAYVAWNPENADITVSSANTVLSLTIGSTAAYVNDAPAQLLLPPALIGGTTMVPIRFIAENFGAEVLYDEKTASVLVRKTNIAPKSSIDYAMLLKSSQKPRLGDSFVGGWSMDRSDRLLLTERSFDGRTHVFSLKDLDGTVTIRVAPWLLESTAEDALQSYRSIGNYATVSHLDIHHTPSNIPYAHIQYKTGSSHYTLYADERTYFHGDHKLTVALSVNHEIDSETLSSLFKILDSLDFTFDDSVEDLSDADKKTALRWYRSPDLGITLQVPGAYSEHISAMNNISFTDSQKKCYVQLSMYSAFDGSSAWDWVQSDYANNRALFSEKTAVFSEISQTMIDGQKAYLYSYTITESDAKRLYHDIFIERDAYFYNIGIAHDMDSDHENLASSLSQSIRFLPMDAQKLGTMLRTDAMDGIRYTNCQWFDNKVSFQKPASWQEIAPSVHSFRATDAANHAAIFVSRYPIALYPTLDKACTAVKKDIADSTLDFRILKEYTTTFCGKNACMIETTGKDSRTRVYVFRDQSYYICAGFSVHPLYDGTRHNEIRTQFFDSFNIAK